MTDAGDGIHATNITLSILDHVAKNGSATLSEIADALDIANSTAHNHLKTLTNHRILTKRGREFQLGIRLFNFGQRARSYDAAYNLAYQTIQDLAQTTNSEADFLVEDGGRMLSLYDVMETTTDTDFTIGEYYHMHTSATGKAILATFPNQKVHDIIDTWGLPAKTENTITDRATLLDELDRIRDTGYAINDQEIVEGLYSVGRAVEEPDGSIFGGVSVGGPTYRLSQDAIERAARPLQDAVDLLETRIEDIRSKP